MLGAFPDLLRAPPAFLLPFLLEFLLPAFLVPRPWKGGTEWEGGNRRREEGKRKEGCSEILLPHNYIYFIPQTPFLPPPYIAGSSLRGLSLSGFLVQLLDGVLDNVGPEISLKVRDLSHARDPILRAVLEDVLQKQSGHWMYTHT